MRKSDYGVHVHKAGQSVNGLARHIGVCRRTIQFFLRGDWKRINAARREQVRVALGFTTMKQLEQKVLREWAR